MALKGMNVELKLAQAHRDLQRVVKRVAAKLDVYLIFSFRGEKDQTKAYVEGKSQLPWPESKHNRLPSHAIDLAPAGPDGKIDWDDTKAFLELAAAVFEAAKAEGVTLRWGGDWDRDGKAQERGEWDLVHFELVVG